MSATISVWVWMLAIGLLILAAYWKTGSFLKCLLTSAFAGGVALGAVWVAGMFLDVPISVTPLSIVFSALLGAPGVIAMLIFNLI